jgi:putative flippase GtrA
MSRMQADRAEVFRYGINGVAATAIHYATLVLCLEVFGIPSAGAANGLAACVGIGASFLGSRYFVFRNTAAPMLPQFMRFAGMYGLIALLHAATLLVWSDWLRGDYRIGFLAATLLQVSLSYLGNRHFVFKP